jgi:hypothetical protein
MEANASTGGVLNNVTQIAHITVKTSRRRGRRSSVSIWDKQITLRSGNIPPAAFFGVTPEELQAAVTFLAPPVSAYANNTLSETNETTGNKYSIFYHRLSVFDILPRLLRDSTPDTLSMHQTLLFLDEVAVLLLHSDSVHIPMSHLVNHWNPGHRELVYAFLDSARFRELAMLGLVTTTRSSGLDNKASFEKAVRRSGMAKFDSKETIQRGFEPLIIPIKLRPRDSSVPSEHTLKVMTDRVIHGKLIHPSRDSAEILRAFNESRDLDGLPLLAERFLRSAMELKIRDSTRYKVAMMTAAAYLDSSTHTSDRVFLFTDAVRERDLSATGHVRYFLSPIQLHKRLCEWVGLVRARRLEREIDVLRRIREHAEWQAFRDWFWTVFLPVQSELARIHYMATRNLKQTQRVLEARRTNPEFATGPLFDFIKLIREVLE